MTESGSTAFRASSRGDAEPPPAAADWRRAGWYDLGFALSLAGLGLAFLWNARGWGGLAYVGNTQYGDAHFWWLGAQQFAHAILWDNINLTFRMGYAIVTGLSSAVLGPNFLIHHKLLCLVFLAIAVTAYFVLRRPAGRIVASAMAALLVFAPYQAEWLAISTSDGTGLLWNLAALLSLAMAFIAPVRLGWCVAFGVLLGLGGLTRPLMSLFIAPAIVLPWLVPGLAIRRRLLAGVGMVAGFALPMAVWMSAYYLHTGSVAVAGHDSTAFYAASDPQIQVWRPDMYGPVEAAARERYGVTALSTAQLSQEFWRQTVANYRTHIGYHLDRIAPTVLVAADFSYELTNPGSHVYTVLKRALLAALALFLAWEGLSRNRLGNVAALAALAALWFGVPAADKYIVVATAALLLLPLSPLDRTLGFVPRAIAAYWWTGVAALYLTGCVFGPPVMDAFAINALGYRLGSQFFFANDWLAVFGFWLAARLPLPGHVRSPSPHRLDRRLVAVWQRWALPPRRLAGLAFGAARLALLLGLAGVLAAGAVRVGVRGWRLVHEAPLPMPSATPALAAFCAGPGGGRSPAPSAPPVVVDHPEQLGTLFLPLEQRKTGAILATGGMSALIWQMAAERRTKAMFFQQAVREPFVMDQNRSYIDVTGLLPEAPWRNRQGLWLFRQFPEVGPHAGYVYYESDPQVQAFFPFNGDASGFAMDAGIWFPLSQYASQLAASGALTVSGGELAWLNFQGPDRFQRWFTVMPAANGPAMGDRTVAVSLEGAVGQRTLGLSFRVEPVPGNPPPAGVSGVYVEVTGTARDGGARRLLAKASPARGGAVDVAADGLDLVVPEGIDRVSVVFHDIARTEMVRVLEARLTAGDFTPSAADRYCR